MNKKINTSNAPQAIGPYSQAILSGNTLYISGQLGLVPDSMKLISKETSAQAEQIFKNVAHILDAATMDLKDIVKITVMLTDLNDFPAINGVFSNFLPDTQPARSTLEVSALPLNAKVEIDFIAWKPAS